MTIKKLSENYDEDMCKLRIRLVSRLEHLAKGYVAVELSGSEQDCLYKCGGYDKACPNYMPNIKR